MLITDMCFNKWFDSGQSIVCLRECLSLFLFFLICAKRYKNKPQLETIWMIRSFLGQYKALNVFFISILYIYVGFVHVNLFICGLMFVLVWLFNDYVSAMNWTESIIVVLYHTLPYTQDVLYIGKCFPPFICG